MLMNGAPLLALPDTCSLCVHGSSSCVVAPLEGFPLFITASLDLLVFTVGRGGEVLGLIHSQVKPKRMPPRELRPK